MVATPNSFAPSPERPITGRVVLQLGGGKSITGTFLVMAEPRLAFVLQGDTDGHKDGTFFVVDWKRTREIDAENEPERWIYQPYDTAYKARRAVERYMNIWTTAQYAALQGFEELYAESLSAAYGDPAADPAKAMAFLKKHGHVSQEGESYFSSNKTFRHTWRLFQRAGNVKGSRKYPGLASASINVRKLMDEREVEREVAVTVGALFGRYVDRVMKMVNGECAVYSELVSLRNPDDLFLPNRIDRLEESKERFAKMLVVRPFTRLKKYVFKEIAKLQRLIDRGIHESNPEKREVLRKRAVNFITRIWDSLQLRIFQYQLERLITPAADALRRKCEPEVQAWIDWYNRIEALERMLQPGLGELLRNNPVPKLREALAQAKRCCTSFLDDPQALRKFKELLVGASNKV